MRTAIVSTYPPRACGIGTFAADVRAALLGVPDVERVDLIAVVNEPSSPQRRGLLGTIAQNVRGDYVRTARMLGRDPIDAVPFGYKHYFAHDYDEGDPRVGCRQCARDRLAPCHQGMTAESYYESDEGSTLG